MKKGIWISATIIVIIFFQVIYGLETLIPTNISWLMTVLHDWGQHYLGWQFYKEEPWQFPLGHISKLYYPVGTNVGFTDSIPLLAIFFKIFAPFLPDDFQYFGLWLFACHLLAAYYTIRICRLFNVNTLFTLFAVIFIAANPVLVYRNMHPALCAHWMLLASIYYYFLAPSGVSSKRILIKQFVLLMVAALVNPYICFMVLGFTACTSARLAFYDKTISWKQFLGYNAGSVFALVFLWWLVGLITFSSGEELAVQGGFGLYGMNLNSFYNAGGYSALLPPFRQVSWHQYEGFMYLGVGMMLLFCIYLAYRIFFRKRETYGRKFIIHNVSIVPLLVLVILYSLFAITHVVSLNDKVLFTVPIPDALKKLGEIFRASARFFWVSYYLILLFVLIGIAKSNLSKRLKIALFSLALLVQLYDTKLLLTHLDLTYGAYHPPIDEKNWTALMQEFDDIAFVPPFQTTNLQHMDYQFFCHLAAKSGKAINTMYVARADYKASQAYTDSLRTRLAEGILSPRTLYITTPQHLHHFTFPIQTDSARLNVLDNYYFIYSSRRKENRLESLAGKINEGSKELVDSAIRNFPSRVLFLASQPVDTIEGDVQYFLSSYKNAQKYIMVEGFGFVAGTNNNKGDSVFITLKEGDKFYKATTLSQKRPDVTTHFKKAYLDDAGFYGTIFKDEMEPGNYQLGILIKTAGGKFILQPTEHVINVEKTETLVAEKISSEPPPGKIIYGLEHILTDSEYIKIRGWAALEEQDNDKCRIRVLFKNQTTLYGAMANGFKRPDVTAYFKNKFNFDDTGFNAEILKSSLPAGKYQVGLHVIDRKRNKEGVTWIGNEIEIK